MEIQKEIEQLRREQAETNAKLNLLLECIFVPQRIACELAGFTDDTMRRRVLDGEITPMQSDGSRKNYFRLADVEGLKPRRQRKR